MLKKLEDWLFWKLEKRWRDRATVDDIIRHREWLVLDIHIKGGKVLRDFSNIIIEAKLLSADFKIRQEGSFMSHVIDERIAKLLKLIASLNY